MDSFLLMVSVFPVFGTYGYALLQLLTLLTVVYSLVNCIHKGYIKATAVLVGYGLYIVFSVFSVFWSSELGGAYVRIMDMILAFGIGAAIIQRNHDKETFLHCMDVFLTGVILISIYSFFVGFSFSWPRLGEYPFEIAGQGQIYYSCNLIYATMFSLYRTVEHHKGGIKYLLISVFLLLCCLMTAVRKCLVIPFVFIFVYLLLKSRHKWTNYIKYLVILTLFGAVALFAIRKIAPSMLFRIQNLIENVADNVKGSATGDSFARRKFLRETAFQAFKENPVLGLGIGQFRFYAGSRALNLYAHNNFLEVMANTGLIGFFLYYFAYFKILVSGAASLIHKLLPDNIDIFALSFIVADMVMEWGQVDYYQLNFVFLLIMLGHTVSHKPIMINLKRHVIN